MGKSKTPKALASNISSTANPAASSIVQSGAKSSILKSSFCPSRLQYALFASIIQGLDSQHLRIHHTITGRLQCEHAIGSKATVTCLDWGYYGENHPDRQHQESNKKRKRNELVNGNTSNEKPRGIAVAFGTNDSEIQIFSPFEVRILGTLKGAHTQGIRGFKFADHGLQSEGWSIGGDGKLVQWDLKKSKALRTVLLPHGPANSLRPLRSSVICASHNAYLIDPESQDQPASFTASTNPVHTIIGSIPRTGRGATFLTAAENDRFINVFNADTPTSIGSLRTESEVLHLDFYSRHEEPEETQRSHSLELRMLQPQEAVAVVNKDGVLEIFPEPFDFGNSHDGSENLKARMKQRTRKAFAQVRIKRPDKSSTPLPLINASFQENEIALAWAEGGVNLFFEKLKWRDEGTGHIILNVMTDLAKAKSGAGVGAVDIHGAKDMGKTHVDESHTVVANGGDADDVSMDDEQPEVISISSAEEGTDSDEDEDDNAPAGLLEAKKLNGEGVEEGDKKEYEDVNMEDVDEQQESKATKGDVEAQEDGEPSFGDLIRANAPEPIEVQAAFTDPNAQSLVPTGEQVLQQLPSGMSLGTVLTQSLRTNDTNLLETCFHVQELSAIRATIERLDSSFATILLQRLAERLHSRPGRAGSLMVWIQWTLVAHGGYLAGQPEIMKKLASLHRVVKDRANSLQPLLSLKGKLDMLEAQMNLRKSMQARSKTANTFEEDDEEGVIYVEGQEESNSEDEEEPGDDAMDSQPAKPGAKAQESAEADDSDAEGDTASEDDDEESEAEMRTTTNGIIAESEDSENDDEEGMFDEEASSTDHESRDEDSEDEVDHESIDTENSSDADTSPPPKRPAKSKLSNGLGPRKR